MRKPKTKTFWGSRTSYIFASFSFNSACTEACSKQLSIFASGLQPEWTASAKKHSNLGGMRLVCGY